MKLETVPFPEILQNIILPGLVFNAPTEMYVRVNEKVQFRFNEPVLVFKDGGRAYFDTFYNGLTLGVWQGQCNVKNLSLRLRGDGTFLLRLGLHRFGHFHRWLDEREVSLRNGETFIMPLKFWHELTEGMLYFCCEALGEAIFQGGSFETSTAPMRGIKLGIVITHFQRKRAVLQALRRIQEEILEQGPNLNHSIELVVIDNSSEILASEAEGATIIPNRNLGGSGGFMRGLLYSKDNGFTHCLFMDDDASCEIESIIRCFMLLRYANSDRLAVAGSLLREAEPYRLFEKGARFDGICRPLKQGLDMRYVEPLMEAEHLNEQPDYGGWWFFGFKISHVKHYAFPFFVRGDDIQFSTLNEFDILTVNGIGCWAEDFSLKSGPMTEYLDVRYHILQNLCILHASNAAVAKMLCRYFFFAAFSYKYATARAVILAMQDVMKGPEFWLQDMEMEQKRAEIQKFATAEKMSSIDRHAISGFHSMPEYESRSRRIIRIVTLNGFLLPSFLLRNEIVFQHKGFAGSLRNVFRFQRVLYEHQPSQTGYVARHDKRQFFSALSDFGWTLIKLMWRCERLRTAYLTHLPAMASEAFWRKIYSNELAAQRSARAGHTVADSEKTSVT